MALVVQLTIRDLPEDDIDALKREAVARGVSLNSVLRSIISAQAGKLRRREMDDDIRAMERLRARIAERAGGYLPDSTQLIREDRDSR